MGRGRDKNWLPEERVPPRRNVLEETLFRRLEDLRKKPAGDLLELVERTLEVLRATKESLLEQRRELRDLASTVETLRRRVDLLGRAAPPRASALHEPAPQEAAPAPVFTPAPQPAPLVAEHVVLLTTPAGYRLRFEPGPPPLPGSRLFYDGVVYEALHSAPSPFPGDHRPAVLALPATVAPDEDPEEERR